MAKTFLCDKDGVTIRGESDDDLVAKVEEHVAQHHPDLVGKVPRDDILSAAVTA